MPEIIKNIKQAGRGYVKDRVQIGRDTLQSVESRIRSGAPTLFELGLPPGLSVEFGEHQKKERIGIIRKALCNFPRVQKFQDKRFFKKD